MQLQALKALIQQTVKETKQFPTSSPVASPDTILPHAAHVHMSMLNTPQQPSSAGQIYYNVRLVPLIQLLDPYNPVTFGPANLFDFQTAQAQENNQPSLSYNSGSTASSNAQILGKKRRFNCCFHETNDHYAVACPMTVSQRIQWLETNGRCKKCCHSGHTEENCRTQKVCGNCKLNGIESIHSMVVCPLGLHRRFWRLGPSAESAIVSSGEHQVQGRKKAKRPWSIIEVQENVSSVKRQKR
jgi:hypothetical protein